LGDLEIDDAGIVNDCIAVVIILYSWILPGIEEDKIRDRKV